MSPSKSLLWGDMVWQKTSRGTQNPANRESSSEVFDSHLSWRNQPSISRGRLTARKEWISFVFTHVPQCQGMFTEYLEVTSPRHNGQSSRPQLFQSTVTGLASQYTEFHDISGSVKSEGSNNFTEQMKDKKFKLKHNIYTCLKKSRSLEYFTKMKD